MDAHAKFLSCAVRIASTIANPVLTQFCNAIEALPGPLKSVTLEAITHNIPNPDVRASLNEFLRYWQQNVPDLSPNAVALALRAANAMDDHHRLRQQLELVWTGPMPGTSVFRRTDQALLELIKLARSNIFLVTFAAYKVPDIASELIKAARRGVEIILVLESAQQSEGKVTVSAIDGLGPELAKSASIYVWPMEERGKNAQGKHGSLHVKCAVSDAKAALISSANLTDYAMNLNMELGLLVKGGNIPIDLDMHLRTLIQNRVVVPQ